MAKSDLLKDIEINIAPYIRSAIAGNSNRLGQGSFYCGRVNENTFKLGNQEIVVDSQKDKDFFNLVWFVAKYVYKEIGKANKSDKTLDALISEVVHTLKYKTMSIENTMKNVFEREILSDPNFSNVVQSLQNIESSGPINESMSSSQIEGLASVLRDGEYASLKNEIQYLESEYNKDPSKYSSDEANKLKNDIKSKRDKAIAIQQKIKQEMKVVIDANREKLKALRDKQKELAAIMKNNDVNSDVYKSAKQEAAKIALENRELFASESKYNKAVKEIREISKSALFENAQNKESQPGE